MLYAGINFLKVGATQPTKTQQLLGKVRTSASELTRCMQCLPGLAHLYKSLCVSFWASHRGVRNNSD